MLKTVRATAALLLSTRNTRHHSLSPLFPRREATLYALAAMDPLVSLLVFRLQIQDPFATQTNGMEMTRLALLPILAYFFSFRS